MSETEPQRFESTKTAFDKACDDGPETITPEEPMVAMVLDAKAELGAEAPITIEDNGCARLMLHVATRDGGFAALSKTTYPAKQALNVGDLVCWVPLKHDATLASQSSDERFGWIGLVFATLEPEWVGDEWALREFYDAAT